MVLGRYITNEVVFYCGMAKGPLVPVIMLLLLWAQALAGAGALPAGGPAASATGFGANLRQPPSSGEWVITSAEVFSSMSLQLNGNLTIRSGASLTLTAVKLKLTPGFDGEFHIEVQSGGSLVIEDKDHSPSSPEDATVVSSSSGFQYLFWVRSGGSLRIQNSIIRNCGYAIGLRGETSGVFVQSSDCTVSNSTFTDCYCGIAVDNCAPRIIFNTFTQNRKHGMYVRDSNLVLEDNLFDGNTEHGILLQSSRPVLRRNIFRGNFQDGLNAQSSPIELRSNTFQANTRRAITAEGSPVCSTRDELIQNKVGFYVSGSTLDCESPYLEENGYCFYLKDVRAGVRNATMLRTTLVELFLGRLSDHTELVSYNNSIRNVTFEDPDSRLRVEWLVRPQVLWESSGEPVAGALVKFFRTATNELIFSFTANDTGEMPPLMMTEYEQTRSGKVNTSSYRVGVFSGRFVESIRTSITSDMDLKLLLDDVPPKFTLSSPRDNLTTPAAFVYVNGTMLTDPDAELTVNGAKADIDPSTANFSTRVDLSEGPNSINITAVDPIFNVFTLIRNVNRHSLPPNLTIEIPPEGLLLNRTVLVIRGTTEPGAYVLVNGVPAMVLPDGSFEAELQLSEGVNNLTVYSADQYKNYKWANRTIIVDTLPPMISLLSPGDGTWTNRPRQAVSGQTDDGAVVLFNGAPVDVVEGNFSVTASLAEGQNLLVFWARDAAGNRNYTALELRLDTLAPSAAVTYPPSGASFNYSTISITGSTEPGVNVSCRGGNVSSDGRGNFSILFVLQVGSNTITIELRDLAGNPGATTLSVVWDTFVSFSLISPENGTKTQESSIRVEGRSEPGATVSIDGNNITVAPDGTFRAKIALRVGTNILVINVTDGAGNRARFFLLVKREAPAGTDPLLVAGLAVLMVIVAAAAAGWFVRSRKAPAAPAAPPGPAILDHQRLVIRAPDAPSEGLRCASCLQIVDESWAVCHTCGGPTSIAEIAPRTLERLEAADFPDERKRRLKAAIGKGFSDAAALHDAGTPVEVFLRQLSIAAQLLLSGQRPELAEKMVSEIEKDLGGRALELSSGKKAELEKAESEARDQMTVLLLESERALAAMRDAGADTRELERAISLARLHMRGGNLEKAYQHTLDASRLSGSPDRKE